jgi:protein-S-isoprenylcysteine O-methyltransferase Ste14
MAAFDVKHLLARIRVPLGFVLAALFFYFADPTWNLLAWGGGVSLTGLLLRGWATGIIRKDHRLAVSGPYALTRNPLYLGSFIVGVGFSLAGGRLILGLAFLFSFFLIYRAVIQREEAHLAGLFPDEYREYKSMVPVFLPKWAGSAFGQGEFSWNQYWHNREYQAVLGFLAAMLILALKIIFLSRA